VYSEKNYSEQILAVNKRKGNVFTHTSDKFNQMLSNPYVGISPTVVMFVVFLLFPVAFTFFISFHNWDAVGPIADFVGLKNYSSLIISDKIFRVSFLNTCVLMVAGVSTQITLGILIAQLIKGVKGKTFFRVLFLLPLAMPMVSVGILWNLVFSPVVGILNILLQRILLLSNLGKTVWLGDPRTALFCVLIAYSWQYMGLYVAIFFAALQGVNPLFYEIADLEGANWLEKFIYVTLPMMKASFFICFMLCMVFTARLFPLVYTMTMGGPGNSTEILGHTIYKYGFRFFSMGSASAISVILLVFIILVVIGLVSVLKVEQPKMR